MISLQYSTQFECKYWRCAGLVHHAASITLKWAKSIYSIACLMMVCGWVSAKAQVQQPCFLLDFHFLLLTLNLVECVHWCIIIKRHRGMLHLTFKDRSIFMKCHFVYWNLSTWLSEFVWIYLYFVDYLKVGAKLLLPGMSSVFVYNGHYVHLNADNIWFVLIIVRPFVILIKSAQINHFKLLNHNIFTQTVMTV